tara:strand:+ start:1390 stop:1893 length:504 start_codon:yes stop_codon:yes gene_type:complete
MKYLVFLILSLTVIIAACGVVPPEPYKPPVIVDPDPDEPDRSGPYFCEEDTDCRVSPNNCGAINRYIAIDSDPTQPQCQWITCGAHCSKNRCELNTNCDDPGPITDNPYSDPSYCEIDDDCTVAPNNCDAVNNRVAIDTDPSIGQCDVITCGVHCNNNKCSLNSNCE